VKAWRIPHIGRAVASDRRRSAGGSERQIATTRHPGGESPIIQSVVYHPGHPGRIARVDADLLTPTVQEDDQRPSRYVVGIDLGTTNSAVTYVDAQESPWRVRPFAIPQVTAAGETEGLESLPSFHYEPAAGELGERALALPWSSEPPRYAVGAFARDHGALAPDRMIASAKSWLSHSGVDRTAGLLPWRGANDAEQLSPVQVSARYLLHLRQAWDHTFRGHPLAEQEVVLTLPASFDEIARELTVAAAAEAGLPRVVLIEEPQAAFYAWLDRHRDDWSQLVSPGEVILVCDIGGGTSDFTLIRAAEADEGKVKFHRVAVGEHLILGGDNLDLALAHFAEQKLGERELTPRQWTTLVRLCRRAKETLLGDDPPESYTLALPGSGSKLIGAGLQVAVSRQEAQQVLLEGFFPDVAISERPQSVQSGFQEFGLPFASDPTIMRHLAAFLAAHGAAARGEQRAEGDPPAAPARPDIVLFNGGLFASPVLQRRVLEVLQNWFRTPQQPDWSPRVLENERLDLAVARGAAYYGMVRRGEGQRIAAGLARTYYVGVAGEPPQAVCLAPARAEAGEEFTLHDRPFELAVSRPVEFPLYVSSTRLTDEPGQVLPVDLEAMRPLPPIRTVLTGRTKRSDTRQVELHVKLTEIGTLELWCAEREGDGRWRLQFDVRSATQTDVAAHEGAGEAEGVVDEAVFESCRRVIHDVFGPEGKDKPAGLVKQMTAELNLDKAEWPMSLLRRIWEELMSLETGRRRSAAHEARWLNLLGFALRPGYGLAVDDWRVAETRRLLAGKLVHPTPAVRAESWILWRRIGGGLTAGQQQALADPLLGSIRTLHRKLTGAGGGKADMGLGPHEAAEMWRLLGSLELVSQATKTELGNIVADVVHRKAMKPLATALFWTLGRLGARAPLYGPLNTVVPPQTAANWLSRLLDKPGEDPAAELAVMQLARRTGDRYRDLNDAARRRATDWLRDFEAPAHFIELVESGGELDRGEQQSIFGESLPVGLRLAS